MVLLGRSSIFNAKLCISHSMLLVTGGHVNVGAEV